MAHFPNMKVSAVILTLSLSAGAAEPPAGTAPSLAPAGVDLVEVPAGTLLSVEVVDPIHTGKNLTGDEFRARILEGIYVRNQVVVPPGATVRGELLDVVKSGRVKGRAKLEVTLRSLQVDGSTYTLHTDTLSYVGDAHAGRGIGSMIGGALQGVLYGVLLGGKKGAGIGAGAGAAAGAASSVMKGKQDIEFDQGARLLFETAAPLKIPVYPGPGLKAPPDAAPAKVPPPKDAPAPASEAGKPAS